MNPACRVLIAIVIVVGFGVYLGIRMETKKMKTDPIKKALVRIYLILTAIIIGSWWITYLLEHKK